MSRPWMPLYVADYLADTGHLTAAEHGAYLLLIMHYWAKGGLPVEDQRLARIARMSDAEWAASRDTLAQLFNDRWTHVRVEFELTEAARRETAARNAGIASGVARKAKNDGQTRVERTTVERPLNDCTNETPTERQPLHSPSHKKEESKEDGADAPLDPSLAEKELFSRGKAVLGKTQGGLIARLLKAKGGNVALARSVIEAASTKQDASEYVARICTGPPADSAVALKDFKKQEWENARQKLRTAAYATDAGDGGGSPLRLLPGVSSE